MALFTRLGDAELADLSQAFALGPVHGIRPIAAGTINSNFAVDAETGRWFVRVNEGKSEADVAWEAQLIAALADGGVATPPPRRARDGRPYAPLGGSRADPGERSGEASGEASGEKWVSVFPWCAGGHVGPGQVTPELAAEFGAALARLHLVGLELPAAWRRRSIYDHDHLVARYASFAGSADPQLARAIAVIGDGLAAASAAAAVRRSASHGIIHGDLFRDNVLWDGLWDGPWDGLWDGGRLVAILDFEQASGGSLAYDLAVCINDWCWDGGRVVVERVAGLLAGYQRVRPLTAADRAALPIELGAAATRFTVTRITDVYLARVDNPDKDFRAFLARCDAWQGPALGEVSSLL